MTRTPDQFAHDPDDAQRHDQELVGASYRRLQGVIDDYRDTEPEAPSTLESLRGRIMDIVHRESALGPTTELATSSGGRFEMLTSTIRQVVREAVDDEPGVVARRVHVRVTEQADQQGLDLEVSVSIGPDVSIPAVESLVRDRVARAVTATVGTQLATMDIRVEDIHDI
ncbi:hypothetical protein [Nesterenkonia sp. HG001]|uniref:hypothetical protein n=1 Tax=Nesterenkonia sp. HG001 TaxID=2983207 RepID=UPI002AC66A61|nr:hypothetical protein [Nesterenkonia sp. HG001]MDZ5076964.1 hypothetical protein [Nesterenkonia sp. HG001]